MRNAIYAFRLWILFDSCIFESMVATKGFIFFIFIKLSVSNRTKDNLTKEAGAGIVSLKTWRLKNSPNIQYWSHLSRCLVSLSPFASIFIYPCTYPNILFRKTSELKIFENKRITKKDSGIPLCKLVDTIERGSMEIDICTRYCCFSYLFFILLHTVSCSNPSRHILYMKIFCFWTNSTPVPL